jgi:uncharacterized damage-inducible protein DinB
MKQKIKKMTTGLLFNELEKITNENIQTIEEKFTHLSNDQLNWKPRQDYWNIREVFAHLYEFAKYYHSAFSKKIDTTRFVEPTENFVSSPLGKSMWSAMKLGNAKNVKRKMKSHKLYNPTIVPSIVTETVVQDLLTSQHELLKIINRAKGINIRKAKIKLANNNVIKFRIGDALLYVIYHNQRHIQQAINLLQHSKFPH